RWNAFNYSDPDVVIARDSSQSTGTNRFLVKTSLSLPYSDQLYYPKHLPEDPFDCEADQFFRCVDTASTEPSLRGCDTASEGPQGMQIEYITQLGSLVDSLALNRISFEYYNEVAVHNLRRNVVRHLRDS